MKKSIFIISLLFSVLANAQPAGVSAKLEEVKSGYRQGLEIALKSYSFRKTIESQQDVDSVIREIFAPEAAIVAGGHRYLTSITTVGAIRGTKVSEDAVDFATVIKPGMSIFDLVWKRGDSELRSVAVTTDDEIVYDNIGTRLLLFEDFMWFDARESNEEREKKEGDLAYAGKMLAGFALGPFLPESIIHGGFFVYYTDNIIWDISKPNLTFPEEVVDEYAKYWKIDCGVSELAGGIACSDYAVLWEYSVCTKDYYVELDGTKYLIPKAEYSDKDILKVSPKDIVYVEKGGPVGVASKIAHRY